VIQFEVIQTRAQTFKRYEQVLDASPRDYTQVDQAAKEIRAHKLKWPPA